MTITIHSTMSAFWLIPIGLAFIGMVLGRMGDGPCIQLLLSLICYFLAVASAICVFLS